MYSLNTTNQFEKDYKLCKKRGYKMELLNSIFLLLEEKGSLPAKYKPHKLTGNYKGFWECHIQPDWLLIWLQNESTKTITFTRTGTHSDLF
jgi:mRNA interferase YafQ